MKPRDVLLVFMFLMALCVVALFKIGSARADEPDPAARAKFFQDVKQAKLLNGSVVNCCGEGDGVKIRMIEFDRAAGVIRAEITDTMRSMNGKVGDVLSIPFDQNTVNIFNPFSAPIAFIRSDNSSICLAGNGGY